MAEAKGLAPLPRKLYECVICKGGFSCWRALGGHMKIHRKERALLRQSTPYDHAAGFSLTFPPSSATPRRAKHSFSKTQFKLNKGARLKAVETEGAEVGEGLDLELRLG